MIKPKKCFMNIIPLKYLLTFISCIKKISVMIKMIEVKSLLTLFKLTTTERYFEKNYESRE